MCRRVFLIISIILIVVESYKVSVMVKQGEILGTREATVFDKRLYYAFYAIPYAVPPTGSLRFKNPRPVKSWKPYTLDARTEYHGACAQAHIVHKHALYGHEDCLSLNIYTPFLPKDGTENMKSVIVWIHGYAFTSSFSHIHGADFLIDNDVLFITVSHRIGVLGFLKVNDSDTNANMGLKDVVMAIKWIRKNVKEFGGDKSKITVMGSSSGATFLSMLLTTKKRKLFSKIILQSGSIFSPSIFQGDHNLENVRLREKLKNIVKKGLDKAHVKDIIMASQKIYSNKEVINFQTSVVPFSPIIETKSKKSIITEKPEEFYKNNKKNALNIPILIGFNSQESISEVIPFLNNPKILTSLKPFFKFMVPFADGCRYNYSSNTYQEISEKIMRQYFKDGISDASIENFLKYASDLRKFPIYKFIKTLLNVNKDKMYVYKFNYVGSFNVVKATSVARAKVKVKGAANGDEICYILKCEPLWQSYVKINNDTSNLDMQFIKQMASLWANFAKYGDPTGNRGNIQWLPMTLEEDNVLHIGKEVKLIGSKLEQNMFKFWNKIYDAYYSSEHCNKQNKHDEF